MPSEYSDFVHSIRRYRPTDLLDAIVRFNSEHGYRNPVHPSDPRQEFALAGVAIASLRYGTVHRPMRSVAPRILYQLCAEYIDVEELPEPEQDPLPALMRMAYQQLGFARSAMAELARTLAVLDDSRGTFPRTTDWEQCLGVELRHYWRFGFGLFTQVSKGQLPLNLLEAPGWVAIRQHLNITETTDLIRRHFSILPSSLRPEDPVDHEERVGKYGFNELQEAPLVEIAPDTWIAPAPSLVLGRVSLTGLYFLGADAWGEKFTNALGHRFEHYVSDQFKLLSNCEIAREIAYNGPNGQMKSCDALVYANRRLILVEAKASRPIESARLGASAGIKDSLNKIDKGITQINRTFNEISAQHRKPEFAHLPVFDSVVGVVVTLEPFQLANSVLFEHIEPSVPLVVCSAAELETVVATFTTSADPVAAISANIALTCTLIGDQQEVDRPPHNPILDEYWGQLEAWLDKQRD